MIVVACHAMEMFVQGTVGCDKRHALSHLLLVHGILQISSPAHVKAGYPSVAVDLLQSRHEEHE